MLTVWPPVRQPAAGFKLDARARLHRPFMRWLADRSRCQKKQPRPANHACLSGVRPRRSLKDRLPISGPPSVSVTPMPDSPLRCIVPKAARGCEAVWLWNVSSWVQLAWAAGHMVAVMPLRMPRQKLAAAGSLPFFCPPKCARTGCACMKRASAGMGVQAVITKPHTKPQQAWTCHDSMIDAGR